MSCPQISERMFYFVENSRETTRASARRSLGMGYGGGYRIRDSATMTLDERLPRLFRRIEVHRLEAEHLAQERERAAADRRLRWEAAMVAAQMRAAGSGRGPSLSSRVRAGPDRNGQWPESREARVEGLEAREQARRASPRHAHGR